MFENLRTKIANLNPEERLHLGLNFTTEDFNEFLSNEQLRELNDLLAFDNAVWLTQNSESGSLVYAGAIKIMSGSFLSQISVHDQKNHYLLSYTNGEELQVNPIPEELSLLYKVQGLQSINA